MSVSLFKRRYRSTDSASWTRPSKLSNPRTLRRLTNQTYALFRTWSWRCRVGFVPWTTLFARTFGGGLNNAAFKQPHYDCATILRLSAAKRNDLPFHASDRLLRTGGARVLLQTRFRFDLPMCRTSPVDSRSSLQNPKTARVLADLCLTIPENPWTRRDSVSLRQV